MSQFTLSGKSNHKFTFAEEVCLLPASEKVDLPVQTEEREDIVGCGTVRMDEIDR